MRSAITPFFIPVLALLFCSATARAQNEDRDICILPHLNVAQISGRVVAAPSKKYSERILKGATVELRHIGQLRVIEKIFTDENGTFIFRNISLGNYALTAKPPSAERLALFATAVEVRLAKAKVDTHAKAIVLGLGWEFDGCHGGYAQIRKK